MKDAKLPQGHLLSDEVDVQLYVFCAPMVDWVGRHVHGGDVVAVGDRGGR